jgi:hypothetical protein
LLHVVEAALGVADATYTVVSQQEVT